MWEILLSAVIGTGIGMIAELGFGESVKDLHKKIFKTDQKARATALQNAIDEAIIYSKDNEIKDLLEHKPFQEEVIRALLDSKERFNVKAATEYWGDKYPEHKKSLDKFFRRLVNNLLDDEIWGDIIYRYKELRQDEKIEQAFLAKQLPVSESELVRAVSQNIDKVQLQITGNKINGSIIESLVSNETHMFFEGDVKQLVSITVNQFFDQESSESNQNAAALEIYLKMLRKSTANLPLQGLDIDASDPDNRQDSMGLANVYIALDTKTIIEKDRQKDLKQRTDSDPPDSFLDEKKQTLTALQAVIDNRKLVILGDPGSGKSTFINYLAYILASHKLHPNESWIKRMSDWPQEEVDLTPIMVVLRDFARYYSENLPEKANASHLWDYIHTQLQNFKIESAEKPICQVLEIGKAIIFLDGLDEVPNQAQRLFVRDAIQEFINRYDNSRFLISCRVLSYQPPAKGKPDLRLSKLPSFELAGFDTDKIEGFVHAWYDELARVGAIPLLEKDAYISRLLGALRRKDLARLAPNPLLLTVMALVNTHKGRLPDARALLYEETVDILLWRWEQKKKIGNKEISALRELLQEANRTDIDLKRVLWKLAYEAHETIKSDIKGDTVADIPEHTLETTLAALKPHPEYEGGDHNWAIKLIDIMKSRSGLLVERQPGIFSFPHRTFQEYLAGAHLASQSPYIGLSEKLARKGPIWRDVILYSVGKHVYVNGDMEKPLMLSSELCPQKKTNTSSAWYLAWLAGDVIKEMGLNRVCDSKTGCELHERVQNRLVDLLEAGELSPVERARAGDTLSYLGDPRFDKNHWLLPKGPTLGFVHIPAGNFIMGSYRDDPDSYMDEHSLHIVDLPEFWMARYPVTIAQFRIFSTAVNLCDFYEDILKEPDSRPVHKVSWYDALEYCRWLQSKMLTISDEKLMDDSLTDLESSFWHGLNQGKLGVTLPSEAEWEKAARGTDGRKYPWKGEFDTLKANTYECNIGTTSAVGCFPAGASIYGILDLSGNTWEWTRTLWKSELILSDYSYPYDPNDKEGEEKNASNDIIRVRRGGSFELSSRLARCSFHSRFIPEDWYNICGFRVVVSPFVSGL